MRIKRTVIIYPSFLLAAAFALMLSAQKLSAQDERRNDLTALIKQHASWSPADFLLNKIAMNRIVMLADAGHGDPLYYRTVIAVLNTWVSKHEEGTNNVPPKLLLFLEIDSARASALKHYFITMDPLETIEPISFRGDQFTTGTLEFYDDLRTLSNRIEAFNRGRDQGAQISFDIIGPEKVIDLSDWTSEKRDRFFVRGRDEYSSQKIKETLDADPNAKALVFYGNAHLQRGNVMKQAGSQRGAGKYLAQYLLESFGPQGGVYICGQVDAAKAAWMDEGATNVGKTFAVDQSLFNGTALGENMSFPPTDGCIYYFVPPRKARHITDIISENLVRYILDRIDLYTDSTKEFYRGYLDTWAYYLSTVAATDWHPLDHGNARTMDSTINAWKQWRQNVAFDAVDEVATLEYFKRYVNLIRTINQKQSTWHQIQVEKLVGFKIWYDNDVSPQVRGDAYWNTIAKYRKSVVVENLIQLLWVASKAEHERAVAVLKKETGMDFTTAKEWTVWLEAKRSE